MKIFLVNRTDAHEDGGREYTTESTVAVCSTREAAEILAKRGGWSVEEMGLDLEFKDSWECGIGFDGREVYCHGPNPVTELPDSGPDPWNTGCYAYGWTAEEARSKARTIYDEQIAAGYKKLTAEIEERQRTLARGKA